VTARPCRQCAWWKRRDTLRGTCWHPSRDRAAVGQEDTCPHHARRVVRVPSDPRLLRLLPPTERL
jgi:hypothetical protein